MRIMDAYLMIVSKKPGVDGCGWTSADSPLKGINHTKAQLMDRLEDYGIGRIGGTV
jgi:hypothetical protein